MAGRRFPAPWTAVEHAESFWVQDSGGQTVGWFYFRTDPLVVTASGVPLLELIQPDAVSLHR
jgi:hypothetical protein